MAFPSFKLRNPFWRDFADKHMSYMGRIVPLGAPALADVDLIVTTTDMKVGTYTIAAQPDVPRNITVNVTKVDTVDTLGTITVVGTRLGKVVTEVITPVDDSAIAGTKIFDAITSVTGAGWEIGGTGEDTITIGVGDVIGLPFELSADGDCVLAILGTTLIVPTTTSGDVEDSGIDVSGGTYNGTKELYAIVVE